MVENESYLVRILALYVSLPSYWKYIALFEGIAFELTETIYVMFLLFYSVYL